MFEKAIIEDSFDLLEGLQTDMVGAVCLCWMNKIHQYGVTESTNHTNMVLRSRSNQLELMALRSKA